MGSVDCDPLCERSALFVDCSIICPSMISVVNCRVIHATWPTPAALVEAYSSCEGGRTGRVAMVEQLQTIAPKSGAKRKLGKQPAENLHSVFMAERL